MRFSVIDEPTSRIHDAKSEAYRILQTIQSIRSQRLIETRPDQAQISIEIFARDGNGIVDGVSKIWIERRFIDQLVVSIQIIASGWQVPRRRGPAGLEDELIGVGLDHELDELLSILELLPRKFCVKHKHIDPCDGLRSTRGNGPLRHSYVAMLMIGRRGDHVVRRSLAVYQAVGERLADGIGGRL